MQFLDNSRHLLRVWRSMVRSSFVREMEFRLNFFSGLLRQLLWLGIFILIIESIFQNTQTLTGWQRNEVLIILALSRLIEGSMNILFQRNIGEIPQLINDGMFDYLLTKPVPAQWHAAFRRCMFYNFGTFISGIILLIYTLATTPVPATVPNIGLLVILMLLGITVFYSLLIIVASLAFYLERLDAIWAFFHIFSEPLTVPFDIFPNATRIALTYALPLAFVVFVPAQAITGRLAPWQLPLAFLVTAIFLTLANLAWRAGLRRYSSASS